MEPVKGNGYIVSVYTPDAPGSNNGTPINQLTTFTMLQAVEPFLPPVDPKQIHITWHDVTSMPSGLPMQFPDGEKFNLVILQYLFHSQHSTLTQYQAIMKYA